MEDSRHSRAVGNRSNHRYTAIENSREDSRTDVVVVAGLGVAEGVVGECRSDDWDRRRRR